MQNLNARQKFAAFFSLTVFGIIVGFCIVFITIFVFTQYTQAKKDLIAELENITENHLAISDNSLTFVKDATGESLRQHLATTKVSVAFLDTKLQIARAYGLFLSQSNPDTIVQTLKPILSNVQKRGVTDSSRISIKSEEYLVLASPIKTPSGELLGYMVLSSSLSQIYASFANLVFICMGLAVSSLLISFGIGLILMRTAFSSLRDITDNVGKIDLNKLHHKVDTKGHPQDEVFLLAQKFNEMIDRLQVATQKQKEFVANASHELKTPITRMISEIETMESNTMRTDPSVSYIRNQLFSMAEIIDELLLLARLREHEPPEGMADWDHVVHKIVDDNNPLLQEKELKIVTNILPGSLCPIPESYAKVICSNLFANAMKFSPPRNEITITTLKSENGMSLSISNYGAELEEEEKPKIFERFYRSNNSKSKSGAGIGLSIVKSLCDMYQIEVHTSSQKDVIDGSLAKTTFTLNWKM